MSWNGNRYLYRGHYWIHQQRKDGKKSGKNGKIFDFIAVHVFIGDTCGNVRESYIDGVWNKESVEEWLTEIQIPVCKRGEKEYA